MGRIIEYTAINTFNDKMVVSVTMPYDPYKAMFGYYSNRFKQLLIGAKLAEPKMAEHVKMKKKIIAGVTNSTVWWFECGVKIVMPGDASSYDYTIILAQLEVLKMAASPC